MAKDSDQEAIKNNPRIVITNRVICFWSQIIQISNICDIGKYIELKKQKYHPWMIWGAVFVGMVVAYSAALLKLGVQLSLAALLVPPAIMGWLYWWEQRSPKKYCFRIRLNGGQEHYVFSDSESFVNRLIEVTVSAMEDGGKSITFIGNIDNSTVLENSNVAINSTIKDSFN